MDSSSSRPLLAWLQLFRLPNVFTAVADVLMGYIFTHSVQSSFGPEWFLSIKLWALIASTCCLYTAGMVLNDVFDYDIDKAERPERPLPSGRINRRLASTVGYGLLGAGIAVAFVAGLQSALVALLLAVAVFVYDGVTKQTPVAPVVMGSCRMLNVLLGMSCAVTLLQTDQLLIAGGLGTYVAGITWFARCEAKDSNRNMLIFGLTVMGIGIAMMGFLPWYTDQRLLFASKMYWPTLLVLLMVSVVRRCMVAIAAPEPANVQNAVKHSIFSLVVLDAAVVLAVAGPLPAVIVLALLIPTVFLGRFIYST